MALALVLGAGPALAQSEPTLDDIYTAAKAGRLDEAQKLVTHVLVLHPQSAKARYVQSELFARQNRLAEARTSLAAAEKIAPGLPFARPDAVQALRAQLAAQGAGSSGAGAGAGAGASVGRAADSTSLGGLLPVPSPARTAWVLPLVLALVVIAVGYFVFRRRPPASPAGGGYGGPSGPQGYPPAYPPGYAPGSAPGAYAGPVPAAGGLSGPQTFGSAAAGGLAGPQTFGNAAGYPPGYGPGQPPAAPYGQAGAQPGYGQQPYAPAYPPSYPPAAPQGPGLGRQIAGGVATGLAVGAGVMAAQALARNLSERNETAHPGGGAHAAGQTSGDYPLSNVNTDMGGQDFGIADGAWDDGGSSDAGGGGGGDWDT